jgi:hypothetical protein
MREAYLKGITSCSYHTTSTTFPTFRGGPSLLFLSQTPDLSWKDQTHKDNGLFLDFGIMR